MAGRPRSLNKLLPNTFYNNFYATWHVDEFCEQYLGRFDALSATGVHGTQTICAHGIEWQRESIVPNEGGEITASSFIGEGSAYRHKARQRHEALQREKERRREAVKHARSATNTSE